MVNLLGIRQRRRRDVQAGFQTVQRVGLDQRVGRVGEVVDVVRQHVAVLIEERPNCRQQTVELLYRVGQVAIGAGQIVGELGQVLVQRHELLVVGVQGVDEQRQAAHHREEVAAALVEGGQRPRQVVECCVDLLALAGQPIGVGLDDVTEGPLGLLLGGPQFGDDVGDGVAQLVPLGGHLGALFGISALSASTGPPL